MMFSLGKRAGLVGAGLAVAVLGFAGAAHAATFDVDASNTSPSASTVDDIHFSTPLANMGCDGSDATDMTIHTGTGVSNPIATISDTDWTNCVGPLGLPMSVDHVGDWELNITNPSTVTAGNSDVIEGEITGVEAVVSQIGSSNCTFTVEGSARGSWNEATSTLSIDETGYTYNLEVTSMSGGCYTLVQVGDPADFAGDFVLDNGDWVHVS